MAGLPFPWMGQAFPGDVTRGIARVLAGQVDVTDAGHPAIERAVVAQGASFGTRSEIQTDAVAAQAGYDPEPRVAVLRKLDRKVRT